MVTSPIAILRDFLPTVLRVGLYRFYFYSHEPNEPPHVHIDRDGFSAKFWLKKVVLAANLGFAKKELNALHELVKEHQQHLLGRWNEYFRAHKIDERVEAVHFTRYALVVDLMDGRSISVPLNWYPRLLKATPKQRALWEICGGGYGIHWPALDEDLSTEGPITRCTCCKNHLRSRSLNQPNQKRGQKLDENALLYSVLFVYILEWHLPPVTEGVGIGILLIAILYGIRQFSRKKSFNSQLTPH